MWDFSSPTRDQIQSMPPAVETWSLNNWTTREVPIRLLTVETKCVKVFECRATGLVCVLMISECQSCKGIKDNPCWPPRYTDGEELASEIWLHQSQASTCLPTPVSRPGLLKHRFSPGAYGGCTRLTDACRLPSGMNLSFLLQG